MKIRKPNPTRRVTCETCGEERTIILGPTVESPKRCAPCSRKRAANLWNGRKADENRPKE